MNTLTHTLTQIFIQDSYPLLEMDNYLVQSKVIGLNFNSLNILYVNV